MAPRSKLVGVLLVLALAAMACNLAGSVEAPAQGEARADAPSVTIRVPANGTSFAEGTRVIIQALGTDSGPGVSRIDLQIDDRPAGSSVAPIQAGQSAYLANFEWTAQGQGLHSITATAYRQDGTAGAPAVVSVNVVAAPPAQGGQDTPTSEQPTSAPQQPTQTPQPSATPQPTSPPATETPSTPRGRINAGVNVRSGPSTFYPIIGGLIAGTEVELLGRNADGTWFLVPYALSDGWVYGQFVDVLGGDVGSLPVPNVPPPPPTATPIPPSPTPVPVTPTVAQPYARFWSTVAEGQTYPPGTCFSFFWETGNVREVYFQGEGVAGNGQREVCPTQTTTYTLHVVYQDGGVQDFHITAPIQ